MHMEFQIMQSTIVGETFLIKSLLAILSNSSTDAHPTLRTPGVFVTSLP